jgi:nitrogen fixation protein
MAIDINIATPTLDQVTISGNSTRTDIEFVNNAGVLLENTSRLREGTIDSGAGGGIAQICAVGYELKWEAGSQYVMTGDGLQIREVNHKFNTIPTSTNDKTEGFYVGSRWILDNGDVYICTDRTENAAVWEIVPNADWNATSGSTAIANKPSIPAAQVNADWNATSGVAEILNKPTIPSVTGFVPYTGANADLDMGTHNVTADHISLNVSPSGAGFGVGATQWNNTIGSSETLLKGGNVTLKNGVDLVARIVNKVTPNTTLTKANYQAVRVSGAQGGRLAINLAQANNDNNSADTIGLVTETIATNQEGFIITVGQLENINTTGSLQGETWVDGDVLYLSPTTAGRLTNIKPTAPGHIVVIGYVEYAHANNGKIYVKIMNGWELDELHNVSITSVAGGNQLEYDATTSLWKNVKIQYTIELVAALTVDFYAPYSMVITSVSNVLNAPTITIQDDGVAYTLGNTIAIGSKITVTASTLSVVNLNITK